MFDGITQGQLEKAKECESSHRKVEGRIWVPPTQLLHTPWPWCVFPLCPFTNSGAFVQPCASLSPSFWRFYVLLPSFHCQSVGRGGLAQEKNWDQRYQALPWGFLLSLDSDGCWQGVGGASAVGGQGWQCWLHLPCLNWRAPGRHSRNPCPFHFMTCPFFPDVQTGIIMPN